MGGHAWPSEQDGTVTRSVKKALYGDGPMKA
jgi:hypothetical protein